VAIDNYCDSILRKTYLTRDIIRYMNIEEVFLLVARGDSTPESKAKLTSARMHQGSKLKAIGEEEEKSSRSRMDLDNEVLFSHHLNALFRKRALIFQRDKKAWLCTTILPILVVTLGFILFLVTSPDRDLTPITLDLSSLNADVTTPPINPIPVNNANNPYTCQPGVCSYYPYVQESLTSEVYTFCGSQALLGYSLDGTSSGSPDCTIDVSNEILRTLDGYQGVETIETEVGTIELVSFVRLFTHAF
jgi:hypothetical protein